MYCPRAKMAATLSLMDKLLLKFQELVQLVEVILQKQLEKPKELELVCLQWLMLVKATKVLALRGSSKHRKILLRLLTGRASPSRMIKFAT